MNSVRSLLRIAIPLALAELGWMAMSVEDNIMVGRLPGSAVAIGAVSLGGALFYAFAIFGIGLMSGLDTLVSHAFGAGDRADARRSLASGLVLALAVAPVLAACILGSAPLLSVLGVSAVVRDQAIGFTRVLVWSLPLLLVYTTLRRYLQGIHYVHPVTFALVTSNVLNVAGNRESTEPGIGELAKRMGHTPAARRRCWRPIRAAGWRCDPRRDRT